MIDRTLRESILSGLGNKKAIIIMGARQVGKSTLLKQTLGDRNDILWLNGDEDDVRQLFLQANSTRLKAIIGNKHMIVIDEAQRIPDIGLRMKLITDQMPDIQLVATGSSSFDLASKVNEPLTGRKREFRMYPLTFAEMVQHTSLLDELRMIPHRLVYGYYPEVVSNPGDEKTILKELTDSYLYRDLLTFDRVAHSNKLAALLKALAFQIGSQVSNRELGLLIGLDPKTIDKYIDILEKSYIILRIGSFSRNLRNELKTTQKIYFWDLGIRNAIIGNLAQVENRSDVGELWENYVIAERLKSNGYRNSLANSWFWRTKQQQEIDYLEEEDGQISAFEMKWNDKKANTKCPDSFTKAYPNATFQVITPSNIETILLAGK